MPAPDCDEAVPARTTQRHRHGQRKSQDIDADVPTRSELQKVCLSDDAEPARPMTGDVVPTHSKDRTYHLDDVAPTHQARTRPQDTNFGLIEDPDTDSDNEEMISDIAMMHEATFTDSDSDDMHILDRDGPQRYPYVQVPVAELPVATPVFRFGQYKGMDFRVVTQEESQYFFGTKKQTRPGKFLAEYIRWVEDNYVADMDKKTLHDKSDSSGFAFAAADQAGGGQPSTRTRISKKAYLRAIWVRVNPCETCLEFDYSGSNAFTERKTCLKCGKGSTSTRTPTAYCDPDD